MALAPSAFSFQWGSVPVNATGTTNTVIANTSMSEAGENKEIVVYALFLSRGDDNSGLINVAFVDSNSNTLTGPICILAQGNGAALVAAEPNIGLFSTAPGADLDLTLSQAGIIGGLISYFYR